MKKVLTNGGLIIAIVAICALLSIIGAQLYLHTTPLGRLSGRVTANEIDIKQLKCKHPITSYFRQDSLGILYDPVVYHVDNPPYNRPEFIEVCDSCGKVIRELTQLEYELHRKIIINFVDCDTLLKNILKYNKVDNFYIINKYGTLFI